MKTLLSIFRFFSRFYPIKKKIINFSKYYLFKYHIEQIVKEIQHIKIYPEQWLSIKDAINSDSFKNGVIDYFLKPNNYMLNTKDIAVALNIGVHGHANESFINENIIDASFYIMSKLRERVMLDENLKYIIIELGKKPEDLINNSNRIEIELIFKDTKRLFETYFNIYATPFYGEKMTIYFPANGQSWVDYKKEESIDVSYYPYDIPKGFFLHGLDYHTQNKGWLQHAVRTQNNEYFNREDIKGETVWLQ